MVTVIQKCILVYEDGPVIVFDGILNFPKEYHRGRKAPPEFDYMVPNYEIQTRHSNYAFSRNPSRPIG